MNRRLLALALALPLAALTSSASSAQQGEDKAAHLFGPDKVWTAHLHISAKDWDAMHPTRGFGFFGQPALRPPAEKGKEKDQPTAPPRGGFGYDFPYVKADLEFDGKKWQNVGVRFKGNSSYALAGKDLKRPFKIDFERFAAGQSFHGLKVINLANNALDPSQLREALAYSVYRAADVPAPRTAFVELYLTVPGKHDRVLLGLYTFIENVDPVFLNDRFGNGKGMLLKPEGIQNLPYLGPDWEPYQELYRPKAKADTKAQKRLIALTRLVNFADDAEFNKRIERYLDVDEFLRYAAACSAMTNIDSFLGFGHNYFLYLNPKDDRFAIVPWDLNNTFGGIVMFGGVDSIVEWSVSKPWLGGNRLTERLFAVPKYEKAYRKHLAALASGHCTVEKMHAEIERMQKAIGPALGREADKQIKPAMGTGGMAAFLGKPADLKDFVKRRAESLSAQLGGKSAGKDPAGAFAFFMALGSLGNQAAKPLREAADTDKDGNISRAEMSAGLKRLFEACDKDSKGAIDEKALAEGLRPLLPRPKGFGQAPTGAAAKFGPAVHLAGYVLYRAGDKYGRLTLEALQGLVGKLFAEADKNNDGMLDQRELTAALNALPPVPAVQGPPPAAPQKKS